jgi:hypothetical protein
MTDVKEEKNTSTRSLERAADYYIQKARYKTATVLVLHGENVLTHLMSLIDTDCEGIRHRATSPGPLPQAAHEAHH